MKSREIGATSPFSPSSSTSGVHSVRPKGTTTGGRTPGLDRPVRPVGTRDPLRNFVEPVEVLVRPRSFWPDATRTTTKQGDTDRIHFFGGGLAFCWRRYCHWAFNFGSRSVVSWKLSHPPTNTPGRGKVVARAVRLGWGAPLDTPSCWNAGSGQTSIPFGTFTEHWALLCSFVNILTVVISQYQTTPRHTPGQTNSNHVPFGRLFIHGFSWSRFTQFDTFCFLHRLHRWIAL